MVLSGVTTSERGAFFLFEKQGAPGNLEKTDFALLEVDEKKQSSRMRVVPAKVLLSPALGHASLVRIPVSRSKGRVSIAGRKEVLFRPFHGTYGDSSLEFTVSTPEEKRKMPVGGGVTFKLVANNTQGDFREHSGRHKLALTKPVNEREFSAGVRRYKKQGTGYKSEVKPGDEEDYFLRVRVLASPAK